MPHKLLRLVVDARYASADFPGIGRVTSALAHAWAAQPAIAALHLITNPATARTHAALPTASARVFHHTVDAHPRSAAEQQQVRRVVNTLAVDWFFSPYLRLPLGHIAPQTLVMIHDAIPLHAPGIAPAVRIGYALALRAAACRADAMVTVSHHAAAMIRPWIWPHPPPTVVPNGVDAAWVGAPSGDLRAIGIHQPFVLCVSSNQPHKNLSGLVAAWRLLADTHQLPRGTALVVCGHVDPRRSQPWQAFQDSDYPIVLFPDAPDDTLHTLFLHARLVVQPSLAEGYGLPALEALAHGVPVLAHDLPVYREYAPGLVQTVDTQDAPALARALVSCWHDEDLRSHIASAGPRCAAGHTWATAAARLTASMQMHPPGR
jgi:glycosyltransferase involved in cell wall biosynthesis